MHRGTALVTGLMLTALFACAAAEEPPAAEPEAPAEEAAGTVERLDPRLDELLAADAAVEQLAEGFQFIEGPVWVGGAADGHLLFSDIPADTVYRWSEAARGAGCNVVGPLPADTVFVRAVQGEFDAVICQYHDQALIPLKLLSWEDGVNVTLGLPIIRTSPDHGTAFDIAGHNKASPNSMQAALRLAAEMTQRTRTAR